MHQATDEPSSHEQQLREARKRTERLINVRDRSSTELKNRLKRAGFSDNVVNHELEAACKTGLVDDERFTRLYIEGKKNHGWGKNRIEAGLRGFGIDLRLYEGYPERFFTEADELKRARTSLGSFHTTSKDPRGAQYRRLISKGFSHGIAQSALAAHENNDDSP